MKKSKGELTQLEIDKLKAKYGKVYQIAVTDEDGVVHFCYVKKPNMEVIRASADYADSDSIKAGEVMYNSITVSASEDFEQDAGLKLAAIGKMGELFKVAKAEIKKL